MRYLAALLFVGTVSAAPIAVVYSDNGSSVTLHDEPGPCVGSARMAVWQSADARSQVIGCYVASGVAVFVSFLDGDRVDIPVQMFKKPASI